MKEIQEFFQPLLRKVLEAVTVETVEDWALCLTNISVRMHQYHHDINVKNMHLLRLIVIHDVYTG